MATVYFDPSFQAYALQARTNAVGVAVDDVTGEDLRLVASLYSEGIVGADSFQVTQNPAGASMHVQVGSGVADTDKAILVGQSSGQGNYLARMVDASDLLTVPAANLGNPRIDAVYLVQLDNAYDSTARVLLRLAYRDGTPAGSPVAPGPDAAWKAYLLLATIAVAASETAIETAHITDERVLAAPVFMPDVRSGGASESASDADVTGTFENGAQAVFTMPTHWVSYEIEATGSAQFQQSGASGAVQVLVDIGGNDGSVRAGAPGDGGLFQVSARHGRTGLIADTTITVQYRETSAIVTKGGSDVSYTARRTS